MSGNRERTVFIGNLDERVSDRVLYDICIQAGRVVDLHIPRDRETDRHKGIAFVEYESEEIAEYAVKLFSGLVTLCNRTLRFAISGQDRASSNVPAAGTRNQLQNSRGRTVHSNITEHSQHPAGLSAPLSIPAPTKSYSEGAREETNYHGSHSNGHNYEYSRRVFGSTLDSTTRTRSRRNESSPANDSTRSVARMQFPLQNSCLSVEIFAIGGETVGAPVPTVRVQFPRGNHPSVPLMRLLFVSILFSKQEGWNTDRNGQNKVLQVLFGHA